MCVCVCVLTTLDESSSATRGWPDTIKVGAILPHDIHSHEPVFVTLWMNVSLVLVVCGGTSSFLHVEQISFLH